MRRRIADYDPTLGIQDTQILVTIAGFVIGISVLVAVTNLIFSAVRGPKAVANPWRSRSPEFQLPSPLPVHNYDTPIEVIGEPYDYGLEPQTAFVNIDKERLSTGGVPPSLAEPAVAD